LEDIRSSFAQF